MARTKSSRGKSSFQMRSGNATSFNKMGSEPQSHAKFLKKFRNTLKRGFNKLVGVDNRPKMRPGMIGEMARNRMNPQGGEDNIDEFGNVVQPEVPQAQNTQLGSGGGEDEAVASLANKLKEHMKGGGIGGMQLSDVRLKEKIEKIGNSPSGIPIYEFNYIGDTNRYSGTMAQDLLHMGINAVSTDSSGYYKVNYSNIDVDMYNVKTNKKNK